MRETCFVLKESADIRALITNFSEKFRLRRDPTGAKTQVLLDTFDWRLFRKALTLIQEGHQLLLRELKSGQILCRSSWESSRTPVFRGELPDGDLGARVGPLIDVRAVPLRAIVFR